ncbi:MAG: hypothetical protein SAJ37_00950 [Oscillatoria sp. PMC 1068.18]|nr:hypothetical protein [Oscillatoria sp. PMC 1076.18]MEC4987289.1 hypothetical protein [Oscillatoria sp. PMC 1068.18]
MIFEQQRDCQEVGELNSTVNSCVQIVKIYQGNFEQIIDEIQVMKTQIRGLQLENRRLLERV